MSLDTARAVEERNARPASQRNASPTEATLKVRNRRRPRLFALMVGLVAAGALLAAYAYTSVNDTQEVLVVANDVSRGETIENDDIKVTRVSVDPALTPVLGSERDDVVGQRASMDLWAGTMLTPDSAQEQLVPAKGESLVGISLTPAQMPAEPLRSGDTVRIVTTPGEEGEVTDGEPVTIPGTVVGVSQVTETGETVVDVTVPQAESADLAARAATGRVALVLDSRER